MAASSSRWSVDQTNYVNIAAMIAAMGVALYIPFGLFLAAYAVLGPLHYLTQISWLHERRYFVRQRRDCVLLLLLCGLSTAVILLDGDAELRRSISTWALSTAVLGAAALTAIANPALRWGVVAAIAALCWFFFAAPVGRTPAVLFFTVLLPTIIHVFVFTGVFIAVGALRNRGASGPLSAAVYVLCPLVCLLWPVTSPLADVGSYIREGLRGFERLGLFLGRDLFGLDSMSARGDLYVTAGGIRVMRLIAFAYTYHYLNWFLKTSVIRWHRVPRPQLVAAVTIWVGSLAVYAYDYVVGLKVLFFLSLLHVLLEFPLNHRSFADLFRLSAGRWSGAGEAALPR